MVLDLPFKPCRSPFITALRGRTSFVSGYIAGPSRTIHHPLRSDCTTSTLSKMPDFYDPSTYRLQPTDTERLSDVLKLSPHVTRILGQNPGMMTLQGTNSYLLQPPSSPLAPIILIDTSSPHTANQYVDLVLLHLYSLGLASGNRETHFDSTYAKLSLEAFPEDKREEIKASIIKEREENPRHGEIELTEYGDGATWASNLAPPPPPSSTSASASASASKEEHKQVTGTGAGPEAKRSRRLPSIEHIVLTHRHLDHVGAVGALLNMLKQKGLPKPKIWKMINPDESDLANSSSDKDRSTTDAALVKSLPTDSFIPFQPLQPLHPLMPGLMLSLIDPDFKHLVERGKVKWGDVPEMARVSVRCLKTPGHTADSVALVMCEGERGVFTGDTVLGQGTTVFTDLASYMTSLKTLLALKPKVLYPAHGPQIPGEEPAHSHIQTYITHRQAREDQIVSILKRAAQNPKSTIEALQGVLERYEKDAEEEWKYKKNFLGRQKAERRVRAEGEGHGEGEAKAKAGDNGPGPGPGGKNKLHVEGGVSALSLDNLVRLIYPTSNEKTLFAAKKSLQAHLDNLKGEGKVVKRDGILNPTILEGKVGEPKEVEGWEWTGPIEGEGPEGDGE